QQGSIMEPTAAPPTGRVPLRLSGPAGPIMRASRASPARRGRRIPRGVRHVDQAPGQEPLSAREEQQLISRFMLGDEEAIREVYQRFARPVYTLGFRLLGSPEAAE